MMLKYCHYVRRQHHSESIQGENLEFSYYYGEEMAQEEDIDRQTRSFLRTGKK